MIQHPTRDRRPQRSDDRADQRSQPEGVCRAAAAMAYQDPVTKNRYVFVTNNTTLAQTIADIYKSRWQIELFFKWIKQH